MPSAEHLNEPVDWINAFQLAMGAGAGNAPDEPFPRPFLATIVTAGPKEEADLTGPMYWVKEALIFGVGQITPTTRPTVSDSARDVVEGGTQPRIHPALNIAEYLSNTHYVDEAEKVLVFPFYDNGVPPKPDGTGGQPPQRRLLFSSVPAIRDIRYNATTHRIQAAYKQNPEEADWVDKINFSAC
jgi:hypothetical protein